MKEEFKQTLEWLKPAIDAILLTADQLKGSAELNEILYTILLAGNFLNSVSAAHRRPSPPTAAHHRPPPPIIAHRPPHLHFGAQICRYSCFIRYM